MTIISTTVGKNPLQEMEQPSQSTKSPKCSTWIYSQRRQNDPSVPFQGKPFNITVIQVYAPTTKAEVKWFYEDLEDLLDVTPKKDVLFIIGDWNAKIGSQEIPGVTGKFGLGVKTEAGQRLRFTKRKHWSQQTPSPNNTREDSTYTWSSPDGQN